MVAPLAVRCAKDEVVGRFPPRAATVLAQERRELRHEDHVAPAGRCLDRYALTATVKLAADADEAALEVDVFPLEAEDLADAKAGEDHQGDDGRKTSPPLSRMRQISSSSRIRFSVVAIDGARPARGR